MTVFVAGLHDTGQPATWETGDWNDDRLFDSDDFITAFQDSGYEQELRTDVAAVPEPGTAVSLIVAISVLAACCRWRKRRD